MSTEQYGLQYGSTMGVGAVNTYLRSMVNKKLITNDKGMTTSKNDFKNPSKKNLKIHIKRDLCI